MTTQTSGQTALITGASSGIGQELAKLFAKDGYNLVLVGRSEDKLHQLADEFRTSYGLDQVTVIGKDLSKENAAQELYDDIRSKGFTINVLVNDAGVGTYGKFANETDWETEKDLIHLNTITLTHLTKLYLKEMVQRNEGKILNLASLLSITPTPLMAVYAATKSYVYNFSASLVNELKDTNVTVTALMPNATDTDFFNKAGASDIKVTDQLQDPVMVAKDGYEALMKGEPKVVPGGLSNKMVEIMGHVVPQQAMASMMRGGMERKPSPEEQQRLAWAWGIGIAAVVVAGIVVAALLTGDDDAEEVYDEAEQAYKTGKAKHKTKGLLDKAQETYGMAKESLSGTVTDTVDGIKGTFDDVKSNLTKGAAQAAHGVKDRYGDVKDSLTNGAANAVHDARDQYDAVKGKATKGGAAAMHNVRDQYDDAAHETNDKWEAIKNIVTKVVVNALA